MSLSPVIAGLVADDSVCSHDSWPENPSGEGAAETQVSPDRKGKSRRSRKTQTPLLVHTELFLSGPHPERAAACTSLQPRATVRPCSVLQLYSSLWAVKVRLVTLSKSLLFSTATGVSQYNMHNKPQRAEHAVCRTDVTQTGWCFQRFLSLSPLSCHCCLWFPTVWIPSCTSTSSPPIGHNVWVVRDHSKSHKSEC